MQHWIRSFSSIVRQCVVFHFINRSSFTVCVCVCVCIFWLPFRPHRSMHLRLVTEDLHGRIHFFHFNSVALGIRRNKAFIASIHSIFIVTMLFVVHCAHQFKHNRHQNDTLYRYATLHTLTFWLFCSLFCFHIENFHFVCLKARCF